MLRSAKRTARFCTTAKIPEMQQTVVNTTVKVVDSLYSGHAMAEK